MSADPARWGATGNSSFSSILPNHQLAWDSTSMGLLKECPRKYELSIIRGYAPRHESVHLTFGGLYHAALERYDHAKANGDDHAEATRKALHWLLIATWDSARGRPWISDDNYKNRFTLVRTVLWYLEHFRDDPVETVILANGKPAVELSFRIDIHHPTSSGESRLWCGHMDRLGKFQDSIWVLDRKTTRGQLNESYFSKFSPDNQFSGYTFAGKVAFHFEVKGLIVDAAQVLVNSSQFQREMVRRSDAQLHEWYRDITIYMDQAESYAAAGYWPMNDKACGNYGGCQFRGICSKTPSVRDEWLRREFVRRTWDPLQVRGDI